MQEITKIEKLAEKIESEKDFDRALEMFTEASKLIKDAIKTNEKNRGRVMEIVRELDEIVERELRDVD